MGTVVRADISKKNAYWIDKHRYYELKHFCLQYPIWAKTYAELSCSQSQVTVKGFIFIQRRKTPMVTIFLAGYISGLVVGTVYGFIIFKVMSVMKTSGSLKIDKSDTDPKLYLELSKEIEDISQKKRIVLEIDNVNFSSHKTQGL